LQALGAASRGRSGAKIIGVTGSVGKTGTKEMLAAAFGALGQAHASRKSYNNHWGVPLTLASMHAGTDFGIFEMGMNHAGELTALSAQVRPDIAIITTIASVHLEHFGEERKIAEAKAEIFSGMAQGSFAILNRDNEWFAFLKAEAEKRGVKAFGFGENKGADCLMTDCLEAANGTRVKAQVLDEEVSFTLQVPGRHIALNALAVLLAVKLAGGDVQKAAKALGKMEPIAGRGKKELLNIGDARNPVTLIDESYNASPVAMRAAFKVLALIDPGRGGRRIAVLGDMLELGKQAPQLHADLALPLEAADVQLVYTCGPLMKSLYDALPQDRRGAHKKDSRELAEIVPDVLTPGDVVMVKGSNGSKMGVVVEALRALPGKLAKKTETVT
jgi:UDP-N-acetylmuramoyl-tripeptide--D-alanyl-D-alanine ligase